MVNRKQKWHTLYHCYGIAKICDKTKEVASLNILGPPRLFPHEFAGSGMQTQVRFLNKQNNGYTYVPFWQEWKNH